MRNVKQYLVVASIAVVMSSCSTKMIVSHVPSKAPEKKLPADGIFYSLPRTVITIDVPVDLATSEPGKYSDYSPIFFPDRKATKTPEKKLTLKLAKFTASGEPDPSAVYYVRVVGGSAVDWSRTFQFGEDGTITSAKEQADNQVSDIALGAISAAAGLAAKGIGKAEDCKKATAEEEMKCYLGTIGSEYTANFEKLKEKDPDLYKRILTANTEEDVKNGVFVIKTNGPILKAVDSVQKIALLTNKREDVITNLGAGMNLTDAIFTRIDSLIAERVKDFTGSQTTSSWTGSFEVRPSKVQDRIVLMKLDPSHGLCLVSDVGGKEAPPASFRFDYSADEKKHDQPVYCKPDSGGHPGLKDVQVHFEGAARDADEMLARIRNNYNVVSNEDTTPFADERSFRFRIPAEVKVIVSSDAEGLLGSETRMLVAQFGAIAALPASPGGKSSMYSLQYYSATGALKSFDLATKAAFTKGTIDSLSGSAGSILDAEKKAADAKAKAADQLNQLDRKRAILEDQVKILAACKTLGIDCSKPE